MGRAWVSLIVAAVSLAGCRGIHCPRIQGPGTAEYQRAIAQRYDPYPESQVGPDVLGGRPRDFDVTRAETHRARHFFQAPNQRSLSPGRY